MRADLTEFRRRDSARLMTSPPPGGMTSNGRRCGRHCCRREKTKPRGLSIVRGGRGVAGRTIGLLGAIFTYAVRQGVRIDNPAHGVVKFAEGRRQRRLTDDEYRQLGKALSIADQEDIWKPAIDATWLMIVTGWRRGEVLGLRWSEIDLPRRTARLDDTKTGASLRPLSIAACGVIQSQPRIGDVVFASRSGATPIVRISEDVVEDCCAG
jgi:integrase